MNDERNPAGPASRGDLVLGLDSSTQSTTAAILDRASGALVAEAAVRYRDDPRLAHFGLGSGAPILPPLEPGEAAQPATLFLAALEALLADLPHDLLGRVAAINVSAQQHGQVWLAADGLAAIADLRRPGAGARGGPDLASRIGPGLATPRAPIWLSANAGTEAAAIRGALGGTAAIVARSGSDSPARFSGAVLARAARLQPVAYGATRRIHLISSLLAAVLAGEPAAPIDWGNGAGTGLMDWTARAWDPQLIAATAGAGDLAGGADGLAARLPDLAHPLTIVGAVATYFAERHGLPPDCAVVAGSGDNPQTKVLAGGTLLSLGTSFVLMGEGHRPLAAANAMYDGLGRPFLFGCRTHGTLTWESLRTRAGLAADDFAAAEQALAAVPPGSVLAIAQDGDESFPPSPRLHLGLTGRFDADYAGCVDSSLGLLALAAAEFAGGAEDLAVTGGAAASPGVLARVAGIWGRRVVPIRRAGAAVGAAVAAACALVPAAERDTVTDRLRTTAAQAGARIEPDPALVRAYSGRGGYLERLAVALEAATGTRLPYAGTGS